MESDQYIIQKIMLTLRTKEALKFTLHFYLKKTLHPCKKNSVFYKRVICKKIILNNIFFLLLLSPSGLYLKIKSSLEEYQILREHPFLFLHPKS